MIFVPWNRKYKVCQIFGSLSLSHTHTHSHAYTHTHTHTLTRTHAYTHTHKQSLPLASTNTQIDREYLSRSKIHPFNFSNSGFRISTHDASILWLTSKVKRLLFPHLPLNTFLTIKNTSFVFYCFYLLILLMDLFYLKFYFFSCFLSLFNVQLLSFPTVQLCDVHACVLFSKKIFKWNVNHVFFNFWSFWGKEHVANFPLSHIHTYTHTRAQTRTDAHTRTHTTCTQNLLY